MPLTLRIQDPHTGEETPLTLRDYEEITLADWKAFNPLDEEQSEDALFDNAIRKVCLYTGLPESTVGQWGSGVFATVLGHVSAQLLRAFEGSDRFKKALSEGTDFVPEPLILIGGKPYDVPLDMDKVSIAQFADWERWEPPTHEADIAAESCAFMLVESGEDYQGPTKEKMAAIMGMPMEQAFDLCAFFFLQKRTVRERYEATVPQIRGVDEAANHGHTADFAKRYRGFDILYRAAELKPILSAIFGNKPTILEYTVFQVMECMAYERDCQRDASHTMRKYQKMMTPAK